MRIYEKDGMYRAFRTNEVLPDSNWRSHRPAKYALYQDQIFVNDFTSEVKVKICTAVNVSQRSGWKPAPYGTQAVWYNTDVDKVIFLRFNETTEIFNIVTGDWQWSPISSCDLTSSEYAHLKHVWGTLQDFEL